MTPQKDDILVKGGVLVDSKQMKLGDVRIRGGRVAGIAPPGSAGEADTVIDATGKLVLPGIVEAHLHPVYADRFETLSRSAAFGGVTTLIPYIGAVKAWGVEGNLWDAVNFFIEEGERDSCVDFSLHCSLMHDDVADLESLIPRIVARGVMSFKGFMAYQKRGMFLGDEEILRILAALKEHGGLFCVHAENGALCDYLEDGFIARGDVGPEFYGPSRPNIAETEAIFRILSFARALDCPVYVVHISARESLDVVELFRNWGGAPIFAETCSHYLTLTDQAMHELGTLAKVSPPLREDADVDALWQAIRDERIDVVGADTAGHMIETKEPRWGDVFAAASGLPGQGTMFTVTYDEGVNKRGVSLCRLVEVMAEKPAKIFGLYPRKGVLQEGSDADLVVFDPTREHTIRAEDQQTKTDYTMYEGRRCLGAPDLVMQRGEILLENGELKARKGRGQFLEATPMKTD
ncbi:MAG: amidohydrolase family protein [Alphaproteobacteria bacterium]|nr:amidohydrolase family protein [Alphaproteobacteria bacterium]